MKLGLWGKKYIDILFYLNNQLVMGETNDSEYMERKEGGMYNIDDISDVSPFYFPEERKEALIISESNRSRRTSIVNENVERQIIIRQDGLIDQNLMDWIQYKKSILLFHRSNKNLI